MKNIKISIITVSYNAEATIEQTIKSVLSQDYENIEYIIIDGGSNDATVDIVHKYSGGIDFFLSEPDCGVYDAMNKGISHSTGDVIAFINSDDYYLDGALKAVSEYFEDNGNVDILCGEVLIERNGNMLPNHNFYERTPEKIREGCMMYSHQGIFAKRKCFDEVANFNLNYRIVADYDWLLRKYNEGMKIQYWPKLLAVFRYGGLSTDKPLDTLEELQKAAKQSAQLMRNSQKISDTDYQLLCDKIEKDIRKKLIYIYANEMDIAISKAEEKKDDLLKKRTYSIFGAGELGSACYKLMNRIGLQVEYYVDNDEKKWDSFLDGIKVVEPQKIIEKNTFVIVASQYYEEEIFKQLDKMGLKMKSTYVGCDELCKLVQK